jgi:uncharacterized repeat protein (TIGR01451 family)
LLALALLATGLGVAVPTLLPAPAAAATGSASGELDYDDNTSGSIGDYDLGYTITVSNTTPAVGQNVTVNISWDEAAGVDPWGYSNINLCWDAPVGWSAAGGVPATQNYSVATPQDTPTNGQVVGTDVPGTPTATADFGDALATGDRADVTSYLTAQGRVYRFCAHTDSIDERALFGVIDALDSIHGSMAITLEAPQAGAAQFRGLLPTGAYVGGSPLESGALLPTDPDYLPLSSPKSPGSLSQTTGGYMGDVRYDYDGDGGDVTSTPITVTPSGTLVTYSLDTPAGHGQAIVNGDGTWNYLPAGGYIGPDSFKVKVSDGDGFSLSTVSINVISGTAAMTVTKSAEETSVLVGEPINYTIRVDSTGSLALHDVEVTDPNAPDCDTTIALIPQQQSETVTCTYTPVAGDVGTYTNVATAESEDVDAAVDSNEVAVEVVAAGTPRLDLTATSTQQSVEAGGVITYEVEVTNSGGVPLTGVVVSDPNAPNCARTVGALAIGARSVFTCTLATTVGMVGPRSNVVTADSAETDAVSAPAVVVQVTAADGTTNVNYTCATSPAIVDPISTSIPVIAEDDVDPADAGQTVNWTFRVSPPSIESPLAVNVNRVRVEFPRAAGLVNHPVVTLVNPPNGAANPPNGQATAFSNASVTGFQTPNSGTINLQTNGSMTYNGSPVNFPQLRIAGVPTEAARGTTIAWRAPNILVNATAPVVGAITVTCTPANTTVASTRVNAANPILDIDKSSIQQAAMPGQTVDYALLVRNRGNVALTGVAVTDVLAPDCDTTIGNLAVGASQTIDCERLITEADVGRLRNLAVADSDQTAPVTSNPADVVVGTEAVAGLEVDLAAAADPVEAGDDVEWTITAQNTGNTDVTGVTLDAADDSDCEAQAVPATIAVGATATIDCTTPTDGLLDAFDRRAAVTNLVTVGSVQSGPVATDEVEVEVAIPASGWADLAPWYAPAGDWMDFWDLADGFVGGTRFRGGLDITRGEFVRMVYRLADTPTAPNPATHTFTDVPNWLRDAVAWAAEDPAGDAPPLMTGLTATRFGSTESITRAQAVRLLFRFAGRLAPQAVPSPPTHAFADVPTWVADAVAWAAADPDEGGPLEPLVTGLTPAAFGPNADITRAQVARMLYRLADLLDL